MAGAPTPAAEAADEHVLSRDEAARLLSGAPWRSLVALGDSVAAGVREPLDGYRDLGWVDRVVEALDATRPGFAYRNVAKRDVYASAVRDEQLSTALADDFDLAIICCGGNDALRSDFTTAAFAGVCEQIVRPLQDRGAFVVLSGMFDICASGVVPPKYRSALGSRLRALDDATRQLAERLGCGFVELHGHPASADDGIYSSDRIHANARGHAIAAAAAIEALARLAGAH
jgi:lysophospholipase L1-like esterase